ncbi:hypothetical protein BGZ65_008051 [Modicella reniformis]|uniref:Aminopeptidase P N-terminal domain-containing protein n=1 Tax=Modicella reniformis TaxID=1440133 RepID=A0A9P6M281_9FUNG|nr:hypothetical protein BGZ65_008051 [Modicella reniformis]
MLSRTSLKYPSKLHCEKVASFLTTKARHDAIIMVKGMELKNRDHTDNELEFRQENNFFYLTGVQEADFYFIYDLANNRSYLIAPDPKPETVIWKGPELSNKQLLGKYDVHRVVRYSDLLHLLKRELQPRQIHGLNNPEKGLQLKDKAVEQELERYISERLVPPKDNQQDAYQVDEDHSATNPHEHGPYGDHHGHRCRHRHRHRHRHGGHCQPPKEPEKDITLLEALILARINKTPIEIALSREATRITSDAHRLVMKSIRPGLFEYQVEALFRYECARQGARVQTYMPIVGTGVHAAYLHYTRNDTQIKDGQLILVDAACEADCYGSDVTRTFPVNGQFSPLQADIYNLVLKMQNCVIHSMATGVDWRDMLKLSQTVAIHGLKCLGILRGDENELFESKVIKVFFPHGLGHLLGLNVHDDGLGISIQIPAKKPTESLMNHKELPVQFHPVHVATEQLGDLPPPSIRRNKAMGSSLYATPTTRLEPGMLLTVEPGIYFNPAQIETALANPLLAPYLNEATIRRYMPVGGVRIEDVVLILPDGSVENITTAPKDPWEIEQLICTGQREYQELQQQGQGVTGMGLEKQSKEQDPAAETMQDAPQGIKKRVGVFKRLLRTIRSMF